MLKTRPSDGTAQSAQGESFELRPRTAIARAEEETEAGLVSKVELTNKYKFEHKEMQITL